MSAVEDETGPLGSLNVLKKVASNSRNIDGVLRNSSGSPATYLNNAQDGRGHETTESCLVEVEALFAMAYDYGRMRDNPSPIRLVKG